MKITYQEFNIELIFIIYISVFLWFAVMDLIPMILSFGEDNE